MVTYCDSPLYIRPYSVRSWDLSNVLLVPCGGPRFRTCLCIWGIGVNFHFEQQQSYQVMVVSHFVFTVILNAVYCYFTNKDAKA